MTGRRRRTERESADLAAFPRAASDRASEGATLSHLPRERLEKLGAALDAYCKRRRERDRIAARLRALETVERVCAAVEAPAKAIRALVPEHARLQGRLRALNEQVAQTRRKLNVAERELSKLAKERLDSASLARLSSTLEHLQAEREVRAREFAEFAERERALKAEAESLRWALGERPFELAARNKAHDEALRCHAAKLWRQRERLVESERLRRGLPDAWRPSTTAGDVEFVRILAALETARERADAAVGKRDALATGVAEVDRELGETVALYRRTVGDVAESRRQELDQSLAAVAQAAHACGLVPAPVRPRDELDGLAPWCEELLAWCGQMRAAVELRIAEAAAQKNALDTALEAILRANEVDSVEALAQRYLTESAAAEHLAIRREAAADARRAFRGSD